jgi:hypothetical protein
MKGRWSMPPESSYFSAPIDTYAVCSGWSLWLITEDLPKGGAT